MKDSLEFRQQLYDGMARVQHLPTREILYIQFIHEYYPEAFAAINGNFLELHKQKAIAEHYSRDKNV